MPLLTDVADRAVQIRDAAVGGAREQVPCRFDEAQLLARGADLLRVQDLAHRSDELCSFRDNRLSRLQQARKAIGLRRRQTHNRTVVQQCAVHVALRPAQRHPHAALHFC